VKFGGIVLQVGLLRIDSQGRIFDMTSYFQDGSHGVISCRKALPSGECTRNASARRMCIIVRQFVIHSAFVLVASDMKRGTPTRVKQFKILLFVHAVL